MSALGVFHSAAFVTASGLDIAADATIEVREENGGALASIFSDKDGQNEIQNPSAFADSKGRFMFFAAGIVDGYSVKVTKGAETYTLNNVHIGSSAQFDVEYFLPSTALPLTDSAATVKNAADNTKEVRILASGLPTETESLWTARNRDLSIAGIEDTPHLANLKLEATVNANALTIALKTIAGNDATANDPIWFAFRQVGLGDGGYTFGTLGSALSLTVSSGSTLGCLSGQDHRLYVGIANDGGSLRLFIYNPLDLTATVVQGLQGLHEDQRYSSTAEGGAGGADSVQTLYSASAFTDKAIVLIGYIESNQVTAGTWATAPSKIHVLRKNDLRTGDAVQMVRDEDDTQYSTTSQSGADITGSTVGITPLSSCNPIRVQYQWDLRTDASTSNNRVMTYGKLDRVSPSKEIAFGRSGGGSGTGGNGRAGMWVNFDVWDIPQTGGVQTQYKAIHYGGYFTTATTYSRFHRRLITEVFA